MLHRYLPFLSGFYSSDSEMSKIKFITALKIPLNPILLEVPFRSITRENLVLLREELRSISPKYKLIPTQKKNFSIKTINRKTNSKEETKL